MRLNMLRMTHKIPHGILVYAHLAIPLASKVKLALLAINSGKLHLTACKKNANYPYQFIVVPSPDDSPSPTSSSLKKSDVPIR